VPPPNISFCSWTIAVANIESFVAERRKTLLSQLSTIDCEKRLKKLRTVRYGNTGAWLKTEPGYLSWLECDTMSVLCCYGIRELA
jgi:hypothetical protein